MKLPEIYKCTGCGSKIEVNKMGDKPKDCVACAATGTKSELIPTTLRAVPKPYQFGNESYTDKKDK